MTQAAATSEMLAEMSACAFRLGTAFAADAEAAEDWSRKRELFQLFDRCFFSVRVAVALRLRLGREPGHRVPDTGEVEAERPERLEVEGAETAEREERFDERDRERESDREGATLPVLLSTLQGVAAEAAARAGPPPAELPTLRQLLDRFGAEPVAQAATPVAPLRTRLAMSGSAVAAVLTKPSARPRPPLPVRRATGPPRRP